MRQMWIYSSSNCRQVTQNRASTAYREVRFPVSSLHRSVTSDWVGIAILIDLQLWFRYIFKFYFVFYIIFIVGMESISANKERVVPNEENPPHSQDLMNTIPDDALNDFIAGDCYLMTELYAEAVQKLSSACEKYTQHFGGDAPECGGVYFQYAKALFLLHIEKCGILESEEFISEQEKSEAEKELFEHRTLVYQKLAAARSILERQGEDDVKAQLELAEILQYIGNLTMTFDNDPRLALCYFKESLELRKRHLEPDNRLLAISFLEVDKASELTNAITSAEVKAEMEQELAAIGERMTKIRDLLLMYISEDDLKRILTMNSVPYI